MFARSVLANFVLVLLLTALPAVSPMAKEVYKTVDENGNVTFTDSPPKDRPSEKVILKETNTQPAVEPQSRRSVRGSESEEKEPYNPRIVSPANEYQMGPAQSTLAISVETSRPLEKGHYFQLVVSGIPHGGPTQSSNLTLTDVRRGRKQVVVSIVDAEGSLIATSQPVTVYVIRPNPKPK